MARRKTYAVVFNAPTGGIDKMFFTSYSEQGSQKLAKEAERCLRKKFRDLPLILDIKELPQ